MGAMCSSAPDAPPNPDRIDLSHFTLLKVVGKGGFGKVNAIQRRDNNELLALKRMSKAEVAKKDSYLRMVWSERDLMSRLSSPFLVNLTHAFQDERELYLAMMFMQGGDLRFHLGKLGCFPEEHARFYAAEIALGMEAIHSISFLYRDLKPDNVLLDSSGHLRISDFGLSVELKEKNGFKIRGNAGTSGYLSPELVLGENYGFSTDLWTYGITIYELIHGRRPMKQWKPTDSGEQMPSIRFGSNVSSECQDFLRALLHPNPAKRLGCGPTGWEEVKAHPWFAGLDWDAAKARTLTPPILPEPDQANCNNSADLADQLMDVDPEPVTAEQQKHFEGFDWATDYKAWREARERDQRLAGLNMSTVTEVGSIPSNASHLVSHNNQRDDDGTMVKVAPAPSASAPAGDTLAPPPAGAAAKYVAPEAQAKPEATAQEAATPAATAGTATPSSPQASAAVAPAGVSSASPPVSARSRASKNEIPFTRHTVQASLSPAPAQA